ncbi:hypothetical protein ACLOJK_039335 [Asimina triloba]
MKSLLPASLLSQEPNMPASPSAAAYQPSILKPTAVFPPRKWPISISVSTSLPDTENENDTDDPFASDTFRMYEFKVRRCARSRSHDWTECPFAHPGEKARRRDPRKFHYSAEICPEFRRSGSCRRGDSCDLSHGVFECWLHPARYRTQLCKDGRDCKRRICFFAHTPRQLRILPLLYSADSRPHGCVLCASAASPTSTLIGFPKASPPLSPTDRRIEGGYSPFSCCEASLAVDRCRLSSLDLLLRRINFEEVMIGDLVESMDGVDISRERDGTAPDLEWVKELVM